MRSGSAAPISGGDQVLSCFQWKSERAALADALVADLLLDPNNADNKAAITKALARMIELYVVEKDL